MVKIKNFLLKILKGKIQYESFYYLKDALKKIFIIIQKQKSINKTILLVPALLHLMILKISKIEVFILTN